MLSSFRDKNEGAQRSRGGGGGERSACCVTTDLSYEREGAGEVGEDNRWDKKHKGVPTIPGIFSVEEPS